MSDVVSFLLPRSLYRLRALVPASITIFVATIKERAERIVEDAEHSGGAGAVRRIATHGWVSNRRELMDDSPELRQAIQDEAKRIAEEAWVIDANREDARYAGRSRCLREDQF